MKISAARHVIAVPDLEASLAFYRDSLGFRIVEIGDPGWRFYVKDAACVMAGECPDAAPPRALGEHSYFAYFEIEDIDDYYAAVKAAGVEIVKPLRDEPWRMREFGLRTVDGHRIMFGAESAA
jgi:catechol 2,3-dioxygenase-like lactoylglutathione lyase family enzyme